MIGSTFYQQNIRLVSHVLSNSDSFNNNLDFDFFITLTISEYFNSWFGLTSLMAMQMSLSLGWWTGLYKQSSVLTCLRCTNQDIFWSNLDTSSSTDESCLILIFLNNLTVRVELISSMSCRVKQMRVRCSMIVNFPQQHLNMGRT